jgi:hypothetical protein
MGLSDKFKNMAKQAQESVAEHREQLHDVVDAAGVAADRKTKGRYTARIAKIGEKTGEALDKVSAQAQKHPPAPPAPGATMPPDPPAPPAPAAEPSSAAPPQNQ